MTAGATIGFSANRHFARVSRYATERATENVPDQEYDDRYSYHAALQMVDTIDIRPLSGDQQENEFALSATVQQR